MDLMHPKDPVYLARRQKQLDELLTLDVNRLDKQLNWAKTQQAPTDESREITRNILGDLYSSPYVPQQVKSILDSSSGTTGNVLIRQDLEPTLYSLFVKIFPAFERLKKGPANGLTHAFNQIASTDTTGSPLGDTILSGELGSVSYVHSQFLRQTCNIAVFGQGRGASFKEQAAVAQGGAPYDPTKTELANGMIRMAEDVQNQLLMGNSSDSGGLASNESGTYNANGFDGWRGLFSNNAGIANWSNNAAQQLDVGGLSLLESIQTIAAREANAGGMPSAVYLSYNAKQALDIEQQGNLRYNDTVEIVPGVRCQQVAWSNGNLTLIPIPGKTLGTYTRASDAQTVEDMYVVDESVNTLRWLYSEGFTVLQIPSGVDAQLSERFIVFGMYGLECAAPLFCGKIRRLA